jgi:hypothetical protein
VYSDRFFFHSVITGHFDFGDERFGLSGKGSIGPGTTDESYEDRA